MKRQNRSSTKKFDTKKFGTKKTHKKEYVHKKEHTQKSTGFSVKAKAPLLVWGKHVVESFLEHLNENLSYNNSNKTNQYVLHILGDKTGQIPAQLSDISTTAKSADIKVITHRSELEGWPLAEVHEGIVHQRVCLQIPEYPTKDLSIACEAIKECNESSQFGCVAVVLDQVQDPRNFGAIMRSAAFFGIKYVIYAQNRQADLSPLVLKASAGGAFEVSLVPVVNINRALEELKQAGAWILGTANTPQALKLKNLPSDRVWVSVFGNEGAGLRQDVLKNCDFVTKISGGTKTIDSLNVSVAAGIVMQALQENTLCSD